MAAASPRSSSSTSAADSGAVSEAAPSDALGPEVPIGERAPDAVAQLPGRLHSIDFLRGLAAMAVMVSHIFLWSTVPPPGIWGDFVRGTQGIGGQGVPLFFVISGFCIHLGWTRATARGGDTRIGFGAFWKRRFRRLYPPYFVVLCACMALVVVAMAIGSPTGTTAAYPEPRGLWVAADFVAHVFMLHGLHPVFDMGGGNPVFWTLAREEYFYLAYFPLLALRTRIGMPKTLAALVVISVGFPLLTLPLAPDTQWKNLIYTSAPSLWIQWALGAAAVEAHFGVLKLPPWTRSGWLVPLFLLLGAAANQWALVLKPLAIGIAFFIAINWCCHREKNGLWQAKSGLGRGLSAWLSATGIFSYSLYLTHQPVRAIANQLLKPLGPFSNPIVYLAIALTLCLLAYLVGLAFFHVVEKRFLNTPETPAPPKVEDTILAT